MAPQKLPHYRSDCPIHMALAVLGDSWSLLIVRDLMFRGRTRFKDFLEAEEGISSNILADRLVCLEEAGILAKSPDAEDRRRHCYRLTERGLDLAPMVIEMVLWSARHFNTGAPPEQLAAMRDHRAQVLAQLREQFELQAAMDGHKQLLKK
jgi:DNA-binding HxlR family transcriptional regulator